MPVFRNGITHPERAAALTRRLADELVRGQPVGQPVVYENRIGQSPQYSVTVVWDDWASMDRVARSRVILDAYELADPSKTGRIAIAMGLTTEDANSMGLLPFAVVPQVDRSDIERRLRVFDRLKSESGVTASAGGSLELRFRTFAEASSAATRLRTSIPEAEWLVVQTVREGSGEGNE